MAVVEDDNPLKALFAHRTHPAFSIRVGPWRSKRRVNDFNALGLEDSIEALAVFAIIVMDEMGERASFAFELPGQLPRLLGHPELGWLGCGSHDVHAPSAYFDEEQDVQRLQRDRFHREEIARQQGVLVMVQKRPPVRRISPGWHGRNVM